MKKTQIPSPARSQGAPVTPRRHSSRRTRSVGSPARATTSGRLSTIVDQFKENNRESALSPLDKTFLNDNTDIDVPRRKSWWKQVDTSRDVMEFLDKEKPANQVNVLEDYLEVMSQENNYTMDVPDSSGSESISSIVVPQRRLFTQKENVPQQKFSQFQFTSNQTNQNMTHVEDKISDARPKNLFGHTAMQPKPVFPSALLQTSPDKTIGNKTKEIQVEVRPRSLFGNRPVSKPKNMFADFIVSESEDEIPEIQPKLFTFHKPEQIRRVSTTSSKGQREPSPTTSITTEMELDDWKLLPSSTMMEHQLQDVITPGKRTRLSKLSEAKESTNTNSTKQSNKSVTSKDKSKTSTSPTEQNRSKAQAKSPTNTEKANKSLNKISKNKTINRSSKNLDQNLSKLKDKSQIQSEEVAIENLKETSISKNRTRVLNKTKDMSNVMADKVDIVGNQEEFEAQNEAMDDQQPEEDEPMVLTYEDNDPVELLQENEKKEQENKAMIQENAKIVQDNEEMSQDNKDIPVADEDTTQAKALDDLEQQIASIVGEDVENILQTKTPLQEKSLHKPNKLIIETPESINDEEKNVHNDSIKQNSEENVNNKDNIFRQEQEENLEFDANAQSDVKETRHVSIQDVQNDEDQDGNDDNNEKAKITDQNEETKHKQAEASHKEAHQEDTEAEKELEADDEVEENEELEENEEVQENELNQTLGAEQEIDQEEMESEHEETDHQEMEDDMEASVLEDHESEVIAEPNDSQEVDEQNESQELDEADNDEEEQEIVVQNESLEVHDEENEKNDENDQTNDENAAADEAQNESQEIDVEQNDSQEFDNNEQNVGAVVEEENDEEQNDTQEFDNDEQNVSDVVEEENDEEQNDSQEFDNDEQNVSAVVEEENDEEDEDNEESESEDEQNESYNENNQDESQEQEDIENSDNPQTEQTDPDGNVTHDTTGRNRKRRDSKTPEAIRDKIDDDMNSFTVKGRNTSIRKTILKNLTIRQSLASNTESVGLDDGTKNSSTEGSGWDSHRTTRKTMRQTFGKDFTPRKSLRALVMEKSAKRQTLVREANAKLHHENSTELPGDNMDVNFDDNVEPMESDHEVSRKTRQLTLENYLMNIKKEHIERRQKIAEQVRNSLKSKPIQVNNLNIMTQRSAIKRSNIKSQAAPKVKRKKRTIIDIENLPLELLEDMKYKPPKRFRPSNAPWITDRLYKFLESKLEPKYDYKARVRAEKLMEMIYNFVKDTRRLPVASSNAILELKREMARLNIVKTHFDFHTFFNDYLPMEVRIKVVPDILNKIPVPREGIFAPILV